MKCRDDTLLFILYQEYLNLVLIRFRRIFLINKLMLAVLAGLQMLAVGGAIWNEAQTHIVQKQIRELWQNHQAQIEAVSNIYVQMEKMSFNDSLFQQINTCNLYTVQNWEMVAKEIQAQVNLVGIIDKDFKDTLANKLAMTNSDYTGLSLSLVGFTMATFMLWKEVAPKQYEALKSNVKQAGKTVAEKIRFSTGKLRISSFNETGVSERQVPPEAAASERITPEAQSPSNKGKWTKGTIAMTALRIGFLAFMIYGFIKGRQHINDLRKALQADKQYFADKGKYQKQLQKVVDAVKLFACDVANLAEASRAVIQNFHNLYLTKAFIQGKSSSYSASRANQITTGKFNLTDAFLDRTKKLRDQVSASDKIVNVQQKLTKFVSHFTQFYTVTAKQKAPNEIFLDVTTQISSIVGKDSIANKDLFQQQKNIFLIGETAQDEFKQQRKAKVLFNKKTNDEKQQIDKTILDNCQAVYKQIILEDPDGYLNKKDKELMASILSNYCEQFYGTDSTGKSIYGINLADFKGKQTYAQILDYKKHESEAQNITVRYDDKAREEKQIKRMLAIALVLAKQKQTQYQDLINDKLQKIPAQCMRYVSLVRQQTGEKDEKNVPKIKLVGSNGLKFKIRGNTYLVEEEIVTLKQSLRKAGQ